MAENSHLAHSARVCDRCMRAIPKKQRHSVGHSTLSTCTNFHQNRFSFATNSFKNTRTEAITLRGLDLLNHKVWALRAQIRIFLKCSNN